jgi:hypothetical protein
MYATNPEQAVKMRDLAGWMRCQAGETHDFWYRKLFQRAALELEGKAEALDRAVWRQEHEPALH